MSEKIFANGINVNPPHEKAPEFVKCRIGIKRKDFIEWLSQQNAEWINLDVKESKKGTWYAEVNTYQKEREGVRDAAQDSHSQAKSDGYQPDKEPDFDDQIPF